MSCGETLVDVLVDDVRFVQDEFALDEDGHLVVRVHQRDVFRLRVQIDVADLEVHALFEQDETAAMRVGAGRPGVKHHHGWDRSLAYQGERPQDNPVVRSRKKKIAQRHFSTSARQTPAR
jgi:hypothetical protein